MIRVFKPWISIADLITVMKALIKKEISGASSYVKKFENEFSSQHNNLYATAVANGSVALDLVLRNLNLKEDDEIIIPSLTIVSCLSAISRTKAQPVFCDVDFDTWNMTLEDVKEKVSSKTKAIIAVHTYGLPCEIKEISEYCKENSIILIEDAAEAHNIFVGDNLCGTFGDFSVFSFYANKHITSGEGGMILTKSKDSHLKFLQMRNLDFSVSNRFKVENFYWNYRIGGLQSALGYSQIKNGTYKKIIRKKQKQGKNYNFFLKNSEQYFYLPKIESKGVKNNYWVYGLVLKKPGIRDQLLKLMLDDNIECRPFFWPLNNQPAYKKMYKQGFNLKNSEYLGLNGFYIPLGSHINKKKQLFIVNKLLHNTKLLFEND